MINAINPLLRLNNHTPILLHKPPTPTMPLTLLHRHRPIQIITAINLQTLLIGPNLHLDARIRAPHPQLHLLRAVGGGRNRPIEDKRLVVARAIVPASAKRIFDIASDLFRGREIKRRVGHHAQLPGRDLDIVDFDVPRRVGHVQRIIQDRLRFGVDEGAEVPVDMVGEHDGRGGVERDGDEAGGPFRAGGDGVGGVGEDGAGEAFEGGVEKGEGEGGGIS